MRKMRTPTLPPGQPSATMGVREITTTTGSRSRVLRRNQGPENSHVKGTFREHVEDTWDSC